MLTIGVIYEISRNPYFSRSEVQYDDRLSEFISPLEVNKLCETLKDLNYNVEIIDGPEDLLKRIQYIKEKCTIVFNKSIGFKGLERKILVPAICQMYDLPLTGSSAYPMTLARHKHHTNRLLKGMGFVVPEAEIIDKSQLSTIELKKIKFPIIVKPNHESDSLGISEDSILTNHVGLEQKVKILMNQFNQSIVLEEYISGEEWKVSIIGNGSNSKVLGCCGVQKNKKTLENTLQTRKDVIKGKLNYYMPRQNSQVLEAAEIALKVHKKLNLQDYSRIDFRIGKNNSLYCMEVSTHPDLSQNSSFVYSALQSLKSYDKVISEIVKAGISRYEN